jgi:hypothetical protein
MSLRSEIVPYFDAVGLISPNLPVPATGHASGNGVCYTSEYYILLNKNGELTAQDKLDFATKIGACIDSNGLLNRAPVGTDPDSESFDDYYACLAACKSLGNTNIPKMFLKAIFKYFGCMNNANPGTWTLNSFLARQPQLITCMISAAFPSYSSPVDLFSRLIAAPLFLISAAIIATNGMFMDPNDSSDRILGWLVQDNLKTTSLSCYLASKIWESRLFKTYGPYGMMSVAKIYFGTSHPFTKYFVTE